MFGRIFSERPLRPERCAIALTLAILVLSVALLAAAVRSEKTPLVPADGWANPENFLSVHPSRLNTFLSGGVLEKTRLFTNVRNVNGEWPTFAGRIESAPFSAARYMIIPLMGPIYTRERPNPQPFDLKGARVALQCVANGIAIDLLDSPANDWFERPVTVPTQWCPGPVKLIAEAHDGALAVGVGTPFEVSFLYYLTAGRLGYAIAYAVASLFFLPLVLPFLFLSRLSPLTSTSLALIWLGAFGYCAYVLQARNAPQSHSLLMALAFLLAPALALLAQRARQTADEVTHRLGRIALIWLMLGATVTLPFMVLPVQSGIWTPNYVFHPVVRSTDNLLPTVMATYVIETDNVQPPGILPYSITDRGFVPAGLISGLSATLNWLPLGRENPASYLPGQMLLALANAMVLFLLFRFPAVAALPLRDAAKLLAVVLATPFFFFNVVYTWPKLASATCIIWGTLALRDALRGNSLSGWMLFCPLLILGILFHTSAALVLPALALYAIFVVARRQGTLPWRAPQSVWIAASIAVSAGALLYHNSFAEKSGMVVSILFTGIWFNIPKGETISYLTGFASKLTVASYLDAKLDQLGILLWPTLSAFPDRFPREAGVLEELRRAQFFSLVPSLMWFPLAFFCLYRRLAQPVSDITRGLAASLSVNTIAMLALLPVVFMSYTVYHLPYSLPLSALMIAALSVDYRSRLVTALVGAHVALFLVTWIFGSWWTWHRVFG